GFPHMPLFNWSRRLRSFFTPRVKTYRKRPHRCFLRLEQLEDRLAPATFVWTGRGPHNNWTTGANWLSGVAPTATTATMDNLVFDLRGLARLSTRNDFASGVFNSITISASNYSLSGNQLTLGDPSVSSGSNIIVNSNATGETISLNIKMGGAAGNLQFFTVNAGADLTMSGKLSGTSGVQLTKNGTGILILSNDNSGFTGPIVISAGILEITNAKALGDTSHDTTVQTNAQLQVSDVSSAIKENLRVNGSGIAADGAILNVSGNNTWSGNVVMDSDTTFGASDSTSLDITGQISDSGAGHNLTKEGKGEIIFAIANTYRGNTTINDGILDIQNGNALGNGRSDQFTTTVNKSLTETGMLQLEDPSGAGFRVGNEFLVLNGSGVGFLGSLYNLNGDNTWSGDVTLGSPAPYGSD